MEAPADRDVRVGDYLDDKLQTAADLSQLDVLIESVSKQHQILKQQVCVTGHFGHVSSTTAL